jgi:hypothetical protein
MSEYWKSTPSYWCKFCETYVRDTAGERKNHESTGKHQNNIQRSLRNLHKNKEREERDQQRAKDEVARLNGLVGGKDASAAGSKPGISGLKNLGKPTGPEPPKLSAAAQRKAHAEQLVALGVELPEELKREITGVGGWETTSSSVVDTGRSGARTLADIKKEEEGVASAALNKGVHKRKAEDDEDVRDEEAAPKKKIWGNALKSYPGSKTEDQDEDLDALLSGVGKKAAQPSSSAAVEQPESGEGESVKTEPTVSTADQVAETPKQEEGEDGAITAPPPVVFKKRKAKR